jgi:hypothetical protein
MKKFIIAACVSAFLLVSATPTLADNSEEVIIGVLGGALGGLLVGSIINDNRRPVDYDAPRYYEEPVPVVHCKKVWVRYYDEYYGRWVKVLEKRCW